MPTYPRLLLLFGGVVVAHFLHAATPAATATLELRPENKPWTRWWWPGSAVDQAGITRELEALSRAGIGGVEITPIYGARGYENRYIEFLSPHWMEMLEFTAREAKRLGLGVDMATGTGWPFGGPWITEADGSKKLVLQDGKLVGAPTKMMVKRAAPGDEGLVIDPYSVEALQHYLAPFSKAFEKFPRGLVRSQFHDSFEYYGAEWSPTLPAVFQQMHGYDIQQFAAELAGAKPLDPETLGRIKSDYRETLAVLHLAYLNEWKTWSHEHGFLVRNQSHGAPANLLDLYGTVDIPETETFGSTPFPIPGLRRDLADVRQGQDLPEPLVIRLASSAAHVMGHPLASSETCTWLREHWKEALSFTKPEIDRLFVA
ncbi:MAG TPA: glycosyl hydrolase, partial [Candidatus Didemnitutus sp.]|nr:glycosyl hydrolase [Candidatus Didemnitutus sp.]